MDKAASSQAPRPAGSPFCTTLIAIIVAACTFLAFWPALHAGFLNWDDDLLLLQNSDWRGLTLSHLAWMFKTTYMGPYQPLTWLSYAIDERCWGLSPIAFHATNLALHALTATMFFFLARRIIRSATSAGGLTLDLSSAIGALLFSVHPLRVESVAWITERRDVLCGVFFVGALLAYIRAADQVATGKRRRVLGPGCVALVIFAALSKGWAMSLPAIMLVLDYYPLRRRPRKPWWRLCAEKTPIIAIAAFTALIAYIGQRSGMWGPQQFAQRGMSERIAQASYAFAFYPMKTIWPVDLLPIYELPASIRLTDLRFAIAAVGVASTSIMVWLFRRRLPAGLAAWLAYAVTIAPFIGIAQAGNQIVADRYSYLSCLAFPLVIAGGLAIAARRVHVRAAIATLFGTAVGVVIVLGCQTWILTRAWHDSFSLWRRALTINPNSWVAHSNLGEALRRSGDVAEAELHFGSAVRINPRAGIAWLNLGELLKADGQFSQAEEALKQAAKHHPEPALAELQLGEICARVNRAEEALEHFAAAAQDPKTAAWAEFGAGVVLRSAGRPGEAVAHLRRAVDLNPSIPGALQELHAAESLAPTRVYPPSSKPYKQPDAAPRQNPQPESSNRS